MSGAKGLAVFWLVKIKMDLIVIFWGFVLGAVLGSFSLALADRSLSDKSYLGRSICTYCKKPLNWYDLFPILSYLALGGKCRYCHKKIGIEYLLVEVVMGILIAFVFWQSLGSLQLTVYSLQAVTDYKFLITIFDLIFKVFFITVLAILFITDIKDMFIPDRIVLPSIVIAFVFLIGITVYKIGYLYYFLSQTPIGQKLLPPYSDYFYRHAIMAAEPLYMGVLMGLLIGGFFWGLIIITRGKGMGGGDVKLGALMGLGLGFPGALLSLMLAFLSGAIFSVGLILMGKKRFGQTIPFGPFLVLGSLVTLFWGNQIMDWYLNLGY